MILHASCRCTSSEALQLVQNPSRELTECGRWAIRRSRRQNGVKMATHGKIPSRGWRYREQTVDIALEPKKAFGNGSIGRLKRRVPVGRVVNAVPPRKDRPKAPKKPRTPHVVRLLRKATEWRRLLASGGASTQAEIARREGLTRARVTQVLGLLKLTPEIRKHVLSMPSTNGHCPLSERSLRPLVGQPPSRQLAQFKRLQGVQ